MADLLQKGSDWLEDQRTQHLTRPVVYQRGAFSVEVSATIGKTLFEVDNGYGVLEKVESRDFLVLRDGLILDGQVMLPERGDRIRETDGAKAQVYEVMAPGKEPHWGYSDPYRKTLRVHTKHIGTEESP